MIIFGTRGVPSTVKEGSFHCPQCNNDQNFRHRKVRNFFTLYFIPLIPLGSAGEYVECRNCKGTFIPRILEQGSINDDFMALYENAMRHSMIKMMLADGIIDENEKRLVLDIINRFGNNDLNENELDDLIKEIELDKKDVAHYLKQICSSLNEHGKETIIKCALNIAIADGNFDESEKQMIIKMGEALEMSSSHLKGIFSEMFEQNTIEE
ncbi:MAG: TerB family tellurite resistance protein [Parvicellaceae bacterium]